MDNPRPAEICERFRMDKSTVSRNLERMRKQGWIEGCKGECGLTQYLRVTPKGNKLLTDIHDKWAKAQKEVSDLLGKEGLAAVHLLTERIRYSKKKQ